jgi:hypothetical protein
MICGLRDRLYALDEDSFGADASVGDAGLVMEIFEKAAGDGASLGQLLPEDEIEAGALTISHPSLPLLSFLQAESSLGAAIVVILVDVEDFLV